MGGQNHQPCHNYLVQSTMLSRALSKARAYLELANVALEDDLLAQSDPSANMGGSDKIDAPLRQSVAGLFDAQCCIGLLQKKMIDNEYEDLPSFKKIDLASVGRSLDSKHMLDMESWNAIVDLMGKGGFWLVLESFEEDIEALISATQLLIWAINLGYAQAKESGIPVADIIEENHYGNFKEEFAQLYTKWLAFQRRFLASSMLSTELWYAFNGNASLAGLPSRLRSA